MWHPLRLSGIDRRRAKQACSAPLTPRLAATRRRPTLGAVTGVMP
jgi:hypothetical protein